MDDTRKPEVFPVFLFHLFIRFYFKVDFFRQKTENSRFCLRLRAENDRKSFQISVDPWEYFTWKSSRQNKWKEKNARESKKTGSQSWDVCLKNFPNIFSRILYEKWSTYEIPGMLLGKSKIKICHKEEGNPYV